MRRSRESAESVGALLQRVARRMLTIIVSVRVFLMLFRNRVYVQVLVSTFHLIECLLRVVNDPSLRLLIQTDGLSQG